MKVGRNPVVPSQHLLHKVLHFVCEVRESIAPTLEIGDPLGSGDGALDPGFRRDD
jgi:hypothetical protein